MVRLLSSQYANKKNNNPNNNNGNKKGDKNKKDGNAKLEGKYNNNTGTVGAYVGEVASNKVKTGVSSNV